MDRRASEHRLLWLDEDGRFWAAVVKHTARGGHVDGPARGEGGGSLGGHDLAAEHTSGKLTPLSHSSDADQRWAPGRIRVSRSACQ